MNESISTSHGNSAPASRYRCANVIAYTNQSGHLQVILMSTTACMTGSHNIIINVLNVALGLIPERKAGKTFSAYKQFVLVNQHRSLLQCPCLMCSRGLYR